MNLGDAIYRRMTGGKSPATEGAMREIEAFAGGKAAAARLVGVHPATWRRWSAGGGQSKGSANLLKMASRRVRLSPGREERIRNTDPRDVEIRTKEKHSGRERTIDGVGMALDDQVMDLIVDKYLQGASPAELGKTFRDSIQDPFYYEWTEDWVDDDPGIGDEDTDYGFSDPGSISFG